MVDRKSLLLWLVVALQVSWVIGTAGSKEYAHAHGQRILLSTQPVDPRDFLRGDYLTLRYDISTVPRAKIRGDIPADPTGQRLHVALAPQNSVHKVVFASFSPIAGQAGEVVVRAVVTANSIWVNTAGTGKQDNSLLPVSYGLERYYVPEGQGNPAGTVTVEVSVTSSGEPLIRELFLDGKPFREAMRR